VLFNFFKKQKPIKSEIKAQLSFDIYDASKIDVNFYIEDDSESTSDCVASMLYCLNKGLFFQKMLEVLTAQGIKNPEQSVFITSIISKWNNLYSIDHSSSEQPVVKPLGAFNANPK
jgi:hypothetical protein